MSLFPPIKRLTPFLALLLILALLPQSIGYAANGNSGQSATDVASASTADSGFRPEKEITGQEFLLMLAQAMQLPVDESVQEAGSFVSYEKALKEANLYNNDYKNPTKALTRIEMAVTLERATRDESQKRMHEELMQTTYSLQRIKSVFPTLNADIVALQKEPAMNVDLANYDNPRETRTALRAWRDARVEQYIAENGARGKEYCSSAADQWYIEENDCLNPNEVRISKPLANIDLFFTRLIDASSGADKQIAPYFKAVKTDAKQALFEAVRRGLLTGTESGDVSPQGGTLRAQAAVIIQRVLDFNSGKALAVDKHALQKTEVYWHKTNMFSVWPNFLGIYNARRVDTSRFQFSSNFYKGELTGYYIIDLEDPKNPYLDKLKYPLNQFYYSPLGYNKAIPVAKQKNAYLLVYTQSPNKVADASRRWVDLQSIFYGIGDGYYNIGYSQNGIPQAKYDQLKRMAKGSLEVMTHIYRKADDSNDKATDQNVFFIVPKYNVRVQRTRTHLELSTGVIGDKVRSLTALSLTPNGVINRPEEIEGQDLILLDKLD